MGMYTELKLNCELKKDTPDDIIRSLRGLLAGKVIMPDISHALFFAERADRVLICDSYSFSAKSDSSLVKNDIDDWILKVQSNLKNYDNEILKFLSWIAPYIEEYEEAIGWFRYEEQELPTIIYATDEDEIKFFATGKEIECTY